MPLDMEKVTNLAGEIPFDKIDGAEAAIENFCTNNIVVVNTNKNTNIESGTHYHDSYEFVISRCNTLATIIDNKNYKITYNNLFAVNPMQEHGIPQYTKNFNLCGIHINKHYLNEIAYSIYNTPDIVFLNDSFYANFDLSVLIQLFLEELRYKQSGQEFIIENLSSLIAANLIRQLKHNLPPRPHNIPRNKENINRAINYMNENYSSGVSCTELADLVKMDKFRFIRSFKVQTGRTPYEYLLDLKIEKAKKMLRSNKYTITEISLMCGFSSHSHFTSTFKKKTGVSPTEFKINL